MKERPIIFDAESVRAILDGRKTQTRRVVVKPKRFENNDIYPIEAVGCFWWASDGFSTGIELHYPYGQPGDRLWLRETFALMEDITFYAADERLEPKQWPNGLWNVDKWRSPIHMPRWASRITLEVTGVRVERLQNISEQDAVMEGWTAGPCARKTALNLSTTACGLAAIDWFASRWDSLNARRGFPWESDCWVWVVEFELVRQSS